MKLLKQVALFLICVLLCACANESPHTQLATNTVIDFTKEDFYLEWIDYTMTKERLESSKGYEKCSFDEWGDGYGTISYDIGGYEYVFEHNVEDPEACIESFIAVHITYTDGEITAPLGLKIGDSFDDLARRFPDSYFGKSWEEIEKGYVLHDPDKNDITFVPEGVVPFMKAYFTEGVVSEIVINYIQIT